MVYKQDIENCFEDKIGINGIKRPNFEENLIKAETALSEIKQEKELGKSSILNHLEQEDDIQEIIQIGEEIRSKFDELVVLGTGGSTLNPQAMVCLAKKTDKSNKTVHFIDNVDPNTIEEFIQKIDLESTAFLVASKSGKTVETLMQILIFLEVLENRNIDAGKHIYIITDPVESPLKEIGVKIGATILDHVKEIGGRFATFTNIGLIPAVVAGIDIKKVRRYAREAVDLFLCENSIPTQGAALQYSFMQKGNRISVMMPYVARLSAFATWYRQIWAESLGKKGKGSTPIKAMGSLDQHSQLQLYLDGPKDKLFNLISCDTRNIGTVISGKYLNDSIDYLKDKKAGDINAALQHATAETLVNNKCPLRHIQISQLDEEVLSKIMVHFILETIITSKLLKVNPFDQPAVECGKVTTCKLLREGYMKVI
ncbi:MAG: glucose-6-phosphate isomerase [Proteobacteria bacterium]|nr:glucose-6-phosphate isomerase [Pseudomonadota bacterium]